MVLDSEGHAKLTDFGLAKQNVTDDTLNKSFCGSPLYLAPEIVKKKRPYKISRLVYSGCFNV